MKHFECAPFAYDIADEVVTFKVYDVDLEDTIVILQRRHKNSINWKTLAKSDKETGVFAAKFKPGDENYKYRCVGVNKFNYSTKFYTEAIFVEQGSIENYKKRSMLSIGH